MGDVDLHKYFEECDDDEPDDDDEHDEHVDDSDDDDAEGNGTGAEISEDDVENVVDEVMGDCRVLH